MNKIATEIHEIVEKSARISRSFPQANSQEVKDWQQQWLPVYMSLQKLLATARSQPGTAASGVSTRSFPLQLSGLQPTLQSENVTIVNRIGL